MCYNGRYKPSQSRKVELIGESRSQFDSRLQLACLKLESLVIADQHAAVNTFPGLYTRPSHHESRLY